MPHVEATWERDFEDTKVAIYVGEKEELAQHSRRKPAWCLSEIEKRKTQNTTSLIGLRDRALIGLMVYTFARVGAAIQMKVEDYPYNVTLVC